MATYAYLHCKPDGVPFYVGKGALRRAKYFGERNPHHKSTVSKYGRDSLSICLFRCVDDIMAYAVERELVKCFRDLGIRLTNYTEGGDGGKNPTPETRARLSEAAKKRGVSEACQKAKVAAKTGKPVSEEHRAKLSAAAKGKVFTEEHRRNISESAKRRGMPRAVLEAAWAANKKRVS